LVWGFVLTRAFIQRYVPLMAMVSRIYGLKHLKHVYREKYLRQALSGRRPSKYQAKAKKQR
jgi:hypothetical protein